MLTVAVSWTPPTLANRRRRERFFQISPILIVGVMTPRGIQSCFSGEAILTFCSG
jgi:hypothetical protein